MYKLRAVKDPGRAATTHPAVPVRYRDEWRNDGMGVAFAQTALDGYVVMVRTCFKIHVLSTSLNLLSRSEQTIAAIPIQVVHGLATKRCPT